MTGLLTAVRLDHPDRAVPRYPMLVLLLAIGVTVGNLSGSSALTAIGLVTLITAPIGGSLLRRVRGQPARPALRHVAAARGPRPRRDLRPHRPSSSPSTGCSPRWPPGASPPPTTVAWPRPAWPSPSRCRSSVPASTLDFYPVYLAVPISKVNILTNVPFYAVALVIIFVAKRTDWFAHLASVAAFYHRHPGPASTLTLGAGVALLVVSCSVSHATAGASRRR